MHDYTFTRLAQVMTTTEAAQRLQVSARHVRRLLRAGRLRGCRVGRCLLAIDRADVARLERRRAL